MVPSGLAGRTGTVDDLSKGDAVMVMGEIKDGVVAAATIREGARGLGP